MTAVVLNLQDYSWRRVSLNSWYSRQCFWQNGSLWNNILTTWYWTTTVLKTARIRVSMQRCSSSQQGGSLWLYSGILRGLHQLHLSLTLVSTSPHCLCFVLDRIEVPSNRQATAAAWAVLCPAAPWGRKLKPTSLIWDISGGVNHRAERSWAKLWAIHYPALCTCTHTNTHLRASRCSTHNLLYVLHTWIDANICGKLCVHTCIYKVWMFYLDLLMG